MADADKKPADPRAEKRKKLYDAPSSKKRRGESDSAQEAEETGQKPDDDKGAPAKSSTVKNSGEGEKPTPDGETTSPHTPMHGQEHKELTERHEGERRDLHGNHRDGYRTMRTRHEKELKGLADAKALVSAHRRHESEYGDMNSSVQRALTEMGNRHIAEVREMHGRHEGSTQGAPKADDDKPGGDRKPEGEKPKADDKKE